MRKLHVSTHGAGLVRLHPGPPSRRSSASRACDHPALSIPRSLAEDVSALGGLLEPDFVGTVPSGVALARDAYIAFHTRADEGLVSIEPAAGTNRRYA